MVRRVDEKTETLYVYVTPINKRFVKKMRKIYGSESNFIENLLNVARPQVVKQLGLDLSKDEA